MRLQSLGLENPSPGWLLHMAQESLVPCLVDHSIGLLQCPYDMVSVWLSSESVKQARWK